MALEQWLAAGIGLAICAAPLRPQTPSPAVADFQKRVANYMKQRKDAASAIPSLKTTGSAEKLQSHAHDLAVCIRGARPNAAQGDIFAPPIASEFQHLIRETLHAPGSEHVKKGVSDTPVTPAPAIAVNGDYPGQVPVASMPPSLLKALPALPKELQYRVVGHTLVLCDVDANLIVDYINAAIP